MKTLSLIVCLCLIGCLEESMNLVTLEEESSNESEEDMSEPDGAEVNPEIEIAVEDEVELVELSLHQTSLTQRSRQLKLLTFDVEFSDGTSYRGIATSDLRERVSCDPYWSSSNEDIAIISQEGKLYAVDNGSTTIKGQCGGHAGILNVDVEGLTEMTEIFDETLKSIQITVDDSEWVVGEERTLLCDLRFDSGSVSAISRLFVTPLGQVGAVSWESGDEGVVSIHDDRVLLEGYGTTTLTVSFQEMSDSQGVYVKMASEAPDDSDDYFLSSNDILTITYGTNGGFGSAWFPSIVYGLPWTGGTDVVSLGGGGSLFIELNGYIIVDGTGIDFTLFENPQYLTGYDLFAERAQVSVSGNGVDFEPFPCDTWDTTDQIYEGCAGVNPVNALENPLDPDVSGGDQFDLADVGLAEVRYLLIEDQNTCISGDPTYPLCTTATTQGFDLDALSILNGVNF